jgi:hypothetical protein
MGIIGTMRVAVLPWLLSMSLLAAVPPEAVISSPALKVRIYLPEAENGFYRGTRFDWSGMIGALEAGGHRYYGPWFQKTSRDVHDFIYSAQDIVAGPCTAATGPAEEFLTGDQALGFDEARPGGTFIKIGVGVLRRPDDRPYDRYHLYQIVDSGKWKVKTDADRVEFTQEVRDPDSGYGYVYQKVVRLAAYGPELMLEHSIRNSGRRPISSVVYNHNFLTLDGQAPGRGFVITVPFQIRSPQPPDPALAEIAGDSIVYQKTLSGEERVATPMLGFANTAADYDIKIENEASHAGVIITGDRPLANMALWSIRTVVSVEPFIAFKINPGETFTWTLRYSYFY